MKLIIIALFILVTNNLFAGPTKVGNGDDGSDLEGFELVTHGLLINTKIKALELLKNKIDDNYIDRAQDVLGKLPDHDWEFEDVGNGCSRLIDNDTPEEKEHSKKVFDYSTVLEETEWEELWQIFKGQTNSEYKEWKEKNESSFTQEEIDNAEAYNKFFDGSGMQGWWD